MKPSEILLKEIDNLTEKSSIVKLVDKLFIPKEKYEDLHNDFLKMSNLCGKAQNKLRQAKKKILDWCWKNNTIPIKEINGVKSSLHLATLDGGWVNVLRLQELLDEVLK